MLEQVGKQQLALEQNNNDNKKEKKREGKRRKEKNVKETGNQIFIFGLFGKLFGFVV